MAFSAQQVKQDVIGTSRMEIWSFDADSVTSGTFKAGMGVVHHVQINNEVSEGQGLAVRNGNEIQLSGLTANDTGTVMVIGY